MNCQKLADFEKSLMFIMKATYWQRHNIPRIILVGFCLFILTGLFVVEHYKKTKPQRYYKQKLAAATLAQQGFNAIKNARIAKKIAINKSYDPQQSGLIGQESSPITSDSSEISIKQSTINPNIAALFVEWLKKAELESGDVVAVHMTGSFPTLNISMLAAIQTLKLNPLIIYSGAASQFGANIPYFSWVDMYHALTRKKIFSYPVLGVSIGGKRDKGYSMSANGISILKRTIEQYNYPFINSKKTVDGIDQRMKLYEENSGGKPIAAFINVGGNMAAIGLKKDKSKKNPLPNHKPRSIRTGIVDKLPITLVNTDSVAVRFLKQGVPVINAHNINNNILEKYRFPLVPSTPVALGNGSMFYNLEYSTWLTMLVLIVDTIVFILIARYSKKYVIRYKR